MTLKERHGVTRPSTFRQLAYGVFCYARTFVRATFRRS